MLVAESLEHCQRIEEAIVTHPHLLVTRWKDRVAEPSTGGWRDQLINVRLVGEEPHLCEVQVVLKSMLTARKGLDGASRLRSLLAVLCSICAASLL